MATIDQEIKKQTAARFKQFREKEALNQELIAEKTETSRTTISKYENGTYTIPIDFILAMKKHFRMSIDWLFTGEGSHKGEVLKNKTLIHDIGILSDNNTYLSAEIKRLKKDFYKLHSDFHEFKSTVKAG